MSFITFARAAGVAVVLALAACAQPESAAQLSAASEAAGRGGNPMLPIETLTIQTAHGAHTFRVEMATNDGQREAGLMFRREMDPDHGMLFDFNPPQQVSFWMHNTFISLDLIFIAADGTILNVAPNAPPLSDDNIPSAGDARAVLELNAGRAAELGIVAGDHVSHRIFTAH